MKPPSDSELDQWLTLERIARSDLMWVLFDGLKAGVWNAEESEELAVAALHCFGASCCYFLASSIASATGFPIAGFFRDDGSLVHAAVMDPQTGEAADILGRRPLAALREELSAVVNPLQMVCLPGVGDELGSEEIEVLQSIAAGMAWMPSTGMPAPSLPEWQRLVLTYAKARLNERD